MSVLCPHIPIAMLICWFVDVVFHRLDFENMLLFDVAEIEEHTSNLSNLVHHRIIWHTTAGSGGRDQYELC